MAKMNDQYFREFLVRKYKNLRHLLSSLCQVILNGYPARKLKVIGVTGTDGKTTTSHLIYEMLKVQGYRVALVSTIGAFIGEEMIDTGFHVTTPDATQLQPLIRKIKDGGSKYLVMETTSHGLDQYRVLGCNFWVGVLTNVTHEHLDYHQTFENYKKAKGKLFRKVRIAVLNKDDGSFNYFKSLLRNDARLLTYSLGQNSTYRAEWIKIKGGQTHFSLIERGKSHLASTKLIGDYNVSNILAATAVVRKCRVSWINILTVLKDFEGVPGRMEAVDAGQPFSVIVDFAHTPNALEKVLKALKKLCKGKLIAVFGCAGERDMVKRPMMGEIATKLADITIFTAEDPRHERVEDIIAQMVKGAEKGRGKYYIEPDRKKAIGLAINDLAKRGDIVIVCGKGHEKSMAYGDTEIPWDDRDFVRKYLESYKF